MKYWKCTVCGYIHEGAAPPEKCPVCGAPAEKFAELPGEEGRRAYEAYQAEMRKAKSEAGGPGESGSLPPAKSSAGAPAEGKPGSAGAMPSPSAAPPAPPFLFQLLSRVHAHPIAVHAPNGIIPMVVVFLLVSTLLQILKINWFECLDEAAMFALGFTVLAMPVVLFTGYVDWKLRYQGARTRVFITKIICGLAVTLLAVGLLLANLFTGGKLADSSHPWHWNWLLFHFLMLALAAYAGHLGGMLVFKK